VLLVDMAWLAALAVLFILILHMCVSTLHYWFLGALQVSNMLFMCIHAFMLIYSVITVLVHKIDIILVDILNEDIFICSCDVATITSNRH
jgi:hypothetical protein